MAANTAEDENSEAGAELVAVKGSKASRARKLPTLAEQHPAITPHNGTSKRIDDAVVLSLSEEGYSTYQIADYLGVNQSTVYRRLQRLIHKHGALKTYKDKRADVLAYQQATEAEIQSKLLAHLEVDKNLAALSESQKIAWYQTLNISKGTNYDKERLERGKSTENINVQAVIDDVEARRARIMELKGKLELEEADEPIPGAK